MMVTSIWKIWFYVLVVLYQVAEGIEVSYNQPKLSSYTCWNPNGIAFPNEAIVGTYLSGLFVDRNNTVYAADTHSDRVQVWRNGNTTATATIYNTSPSPNSLFIKSNGDIYVSSIERAIVERWTVNATNSVIVMNTNSYCSGLFVDVADYLYCSLDAEHRVVKQSLGVRTNISITIAGNGSSGSTSNMLAGPLGIFVDINFDLYVADCENDRVQLFSPGQVNGITVAGKGATSSIKLTCPTAIFFDGDHNLFIVDSWNHRIIGSTPNGFYCLAGCLSEQGSASNKLYFPSVAAFDSYGNIFVADRYNNRIQKFLLTTNTINSSLVTQSTYSSVLTPSSSTYSPTGCGASNHYYEAIEVNVMKTSCYSFDSSNSIDAVGYIYKHNFNPFTPSENLILIIDASLNNTQLKVNTNLQAGTRYILVVTTSFPNIIGTFSILVSGANNVSLNRINTSPVYQSTYSSTLTVNSPTYLRTGCDASNYYYEAIQVNVAKTGDYNLRSNSRMDTVGYVYKNNFNLINLSENLLPQNHNGCSERQFNLNVNLQTDTTYILFVSTSSQNIIGEFSIIASGPDTINLNYISAPSLVQSMYSSELTENSRIYSRVNHCGEANYFYETIQVNVVEDGYYTFTSMSAVNTVGYIYMNNFNTFDLLENFLSQDDNSCGGNQFKIKTHLRANTTYVLVVTTSVPRETGQFSIRAYGLNNVRLTYYNTPSILQSMYGSQLTTNSLTYSRTSTVSKFYYEAIQVKVIEAGWYVLTSTSNINTYGYIYKSNFNPFNPFDNLLSQDDDNSCKPYQFQFIIHLQPSVTYVLVVTTFSPEVTGLFSILVHGPNHLNLHRIDTTQSTTTSPSNGHTIQLMPLFWIITICTLGVVSCLNF